MNLAHITPTSLSWPHSGMRPVYRKRSAKSSQGPVPAPLFREIKVSGGSPFASWGAEVSLSSGLAVRFSAGAAPAWIGAVVAELRRPC